MFAAIAVRHMSDSHKRLQEYLSLNPKLDNSFRHKQKNDFVLFYCSPHSSWSLSQKPYSDFLAFLDDLDKAESAAVFISELSIHVVNQLSSVGIEYHAYESDKRFDGYNHYITFLGEEI